MSQDFEFYETPETSTRYLFEAMRLQGHRIHGRLAEPCAGSGAILRAAMYFGRPYEWATNDFDPKWASTTIGPSTTLDATDERTWRDMEAALNGEIDWTVSNPPFSLATEILAHALRFSQIGVAMHLRGSFNEPLKTGLRRSFLREHPPTGTLWLPRFAFQRSKKTGEWTTDTVTCCWLVWVRGAREQWVEYAPEWVLEGLEAETPRYRQRMDALAEAA